jgi:hypothetical protein
MTSPKPAQYGSEAWAVIDNIPSQIGVQACPELARHRTPIKNLYATGSAWHRWDAGPVGRVCCYKIIAEDFGLKTVEGHPGERRRATEIQWN